jgi:hypothetical protein
MCYFEAIAFSNNSMPRGTKLFVQTILDQFCSSLRMEKE